MDQALAELETKLEAHKASPSAATADALAIATAEALLKVAGTTGRCSQFIYEMSGVDCKTEPATLEG